ncbi:MAG: O-antigen ligase family protein [Candidatus Omnitrophica bacterium]|nr:O-antigen ligase family protein [Candidatus Omnitrophota bacterium]
MIRISLFLIITMTVILMNFKKPKYGLFFLLGLMLLRDGYLFEHVPQIYFSWHMPLIFGWLTLLSWIIHTLVKSEKVYLPFGFLALLFLSAIIFLSKRNAFEPAATQHMFMEYVKNLILFFLIINIVKTKEDLKHINLLLIGIMTFLVLFAYHRYKTTWYEIAIPHYQYVDRNFFAQSIVAVLPLAVIFFEEKVNIVVKLFFAAVIAAFCGGVVLTYSRGGLLALLLALFFIFLQSKKKARLITIGLIILVAFLPRIGQKYRNRMHSISDYEEDPSAMTRIATWKAGINMAMEHPVVGVGAGNFGNYYYIYAPDELKQYADFEMNIHNVFLQLLSETGFTGLGLFLLVIWNCFIANAYVRHRNFRLPADKKIDLTKSNLLRASLISLCGSGFFLPGAYYGYFYIIIALNLVGNKMIIEEINIIEGKTE